MKTLRLILCGGIASAIAFSSCQRNVRDETGSFQQDSKNSTAASMDEPAVNKASAGSCNSNAYTVTLVSRTLVDGNWEWIWTVQNPNPGNGSNGTAQDLSNWGMQLGACFNTASLVSAAYSSNGSDWTGFTPNIQPDTSQGCLTTPTLKFDFGTTGSATSYYRLVISQDYAIGSTLAYYKAGQCCSTFTFNGINCAGGPVEIVE